MPVFSHSKLSCFEQCPRKYAFRYVEKVPVEAKEGVEAFMGKRVHESLQWLYQEVSKERKPRMEELVAFFNARWQGEWSDAVEIVDGRYAAEDYRKIGEKCLEGYYCAKTPFDGEKTVALEEPIVVPLGGDYLIRGFIDRLSIKDGFFEIHDYKTNKQLPSQQEKDGDRQLALYQLGVIKKWPSARGVKLVWHFLRFNAEIKSERTPQQLVELKEKTLVQIKEIERREKSNAFEPIVSSLCNWCEYKGICPAWNEKKVLSLPEATMLVDEYAALKERKKEFEGKEGNRIEEIEGLLKEIAEENGCGEIKGSNCVLKIKKSESTLFAPREEELQELEKLLEKEGLLEKVVGVDAKKLRELFESGEISEEAKEKLAAFSQKRETTRFYLSKN